MEKIYVVTDLGPGDGGKGTIVHALAHKLRPKIIIKQGGAQGSHGVCTSQGEKFNFSQWGCGTFEAIPTHLSSQMVISPVGLVNEAEALQRTGIYDPFTLLSVDPTCVCATPYHKIASQLNELMRGDQPRGTVGTGVGEAYRMMNFSGKMTIQALHLKDSRATTRKLREQAEYYRAKYIDIPRDNGVPGDAKLIAENLNLLFDNEYFSFIVNLFDMVGRKLWFVWLSDLLKKAGTAIVESSHGVLTDSEDEWMKPHVSAIRTLPEFTEEMLRIEGYAGEVCHLGVHRCYEIRHGAGPMPTYDPEFTKRMLPDSHKETNRWQGEVRAGALDFNLLRHALDTCRDKYPWDEFDGICLTWFDQLFEADQIRWQICKKYDTERQSNESYGDFLRRATPIIEEHVLKTPASEQEVFDFAQEVLVGMPPLKILSVGPTELDKIGLENI